MPISYTDQFWVMDPFAPPNSGDPLTAFDYELIDDQPDGEITGLGSDSINGHDVIGVFNGDTITVRLADNSVITVEGCTFYLDNGTQVFTPTDGTVLTDVTFLSSTFVWEDTEFDVGDLGPPCFTPGALIETPSGARLVEELQVGDLVNTRDNGPQEIRWVGRSVIAGRDNFAPVRICKGALGNARDLIVSPQHRMLVTGWRAELFYGETEVLVAAKHLINGDTIYAAPVEKVTYIHLMFERHEVIYAEGIATESFDPGGRMAQENPALFQELSRLFPEKAREGKWQPDTARIILRHHEAALLAA
ncbi:MAG: type I secretion protein [Robiginitomaculum sp.]|nr:MAG: type I secretion protein [Robiginitomaculum sp.]